MSGSSTAIGEWVRDCRRRQELDLAATGCGMRPWQGPLRRCRGWGSVRRRGVGGWPSGRSGRCRGTRWSWRSSRCRRAHPRRGSASPARSGGGWTGWVPSRAGSSRCAVRSDPPASPGRPAGRRSRRGLSSVWTSTLFSSAVLSRSVSWAWWCEPGMTCIAEFRRPRRRPPAQAERDHSAGRQQPVGGVLAPTDPLGVARQLGRTGGCAAGSRCLFSRSATTSMMRRSVMITVYQHVIPEMQADAIAPLCAAIFRGRSPTASVQPRTLNHSTTHETLIRHANYGLHRITGHLQMDGQGLDRGRGRCYVG